MITMVDFLPFDSIEDRELRFSVVATQYRGKWVLCRHKDRTSWELPGGHREKDESVFETARRELSEETGADKFLLKPVCVYRITDQGPLFDNTGCCGALFFARVLHFGRLPENEIAQMKQFDAPPEEWTYPTVHPFLLARVHEFLDILIRPAEPGDATEICRLNREALGYDYPQEKTTARLRRLLTTPEQLVLVACAQQRVIGYIHLCDHLCCFTDPLMELRSLAVEAPYRRLGAAKKLLSEAEGWAKRHGACGIHLAAQLRSEDAHSFYSDCGYSQTGEELSFVKRFPGCV